jgi:non-canonical purine NTP pyrophosphatase (RdgB/HAM1 family)
LTEKIILATKNKNKVQEIREIFQNNSLIGLDGLPEIKEIEENGSTFEENALLKATGYFKQLNIPVIAEDSGLVVPALNGSPGIFSARYGGPQADAGENNRKLLREMETIPDRRRTAYFICCAVYYDGKKTFIAEGRVDGMITHTPRGTGGFGYDPVFLIPKYHKTFAELGPAVKNQISHRRQAFIKLKKSII